jgi:uncharacterized protein (DUF2147 family)
MKKYYFFAALATVGLFASCSSDEDFSDASEARQAVIDDSEKVAIEFQLGIPSSTYTRGTGTVGGIVNAADNYWGGQTFKVSMFNKGTLDIALQDPTDATSKIFENTIFTTPNQLGGVPANQTTARVVEATETADGGLKIVENVSYFPQEGNFDFWAYRLDDAETAAPALNAAGDALEAAFTITGAQDIMVAKAVPSDAAAAAAISEDKIFSAYSVRRNVAPVLNFQHLLTRLQFKVKASQALSVGVADKTQGATQAELNAAPNAVRVTAIKVTSLASGKLVTAYTAANEPQRITWTDGSEAVLSLKERGREITTAQTGVFTDNMYTGANDLVHNFTDASAGYSRNDDPAVYDSNVTDPTSGFPTGTYYASVTDALAAGETEFYAYKKLTNAVYGNPDVAKDLVPLTPVYPLWDATTGQYATPVGEALLVAPQEGAIGYQLTIEMAQDVSDTREIDYYNITVDAENNGTNVTYYFATQAAADAAQALYDAWAADFNDATNQAAWDAARANYQTTPVVVPSAPVTKTSSKTVTLKGKESASAGGSTYANFEAGKTYTVTITLNDLEDVNTGSTPGGFTEGEDLDLELDEL